MFLETRAGLLARVAIARVRASASLGESVFQLASRVRAAWGSWQ